MMFKGSNLRALATDKNGDVNPKGDTVIISEMPEDKWSHPRWLMRIAVIDNFVKHELCRPSVQLKKEIWLVRSRTRRDTDFGPGALMPVVNDDWEVMKENVNVSLRCYRRWYDVITTGSKVMSEAELVEMLS